MLPWRRLGGLRTAGVLPFGVAESARRTAHDDVSRLEAAVRAAHDPVPLFQPRGKVAHAPPRHRHMDTETRANAKRPAAVRVVGSVSSQVPEELIALATDTLVTPPHADAAEQSATRRSLPYFVGQGDPPPPSDADVPVLALVLDLSEFHQLVDGTIVAPLAAFVAEAAAAVADDTAAEAWVIAVTPAARQCARAKEAFEAALASANAEAAEAARVGFFALPGGTTETVCHLLGQCEGAVSLTTNHQASGRLKVLVAPSRASFDTTNVSALYATHMLDTTSFVADEPVLAAAGRRGVHALVFPYALHGTEGAVMDAATYSDSKVAVGLVEAQRGALNAAVRQATRHLLLTPAPPRTTDRS